MLMVPASNVSVPLTVVTRTLSRVPPSAIPPAPWSEIGVGELLRTLEKFHVFPVTFSKTMFPNLTAAAAPEASTSNPVVDVAAFVALAAATAVPQDEYPDVVKEPEPIWTWILLVPLVDTPLNITVIRLTHDGMPVKSIDVPDVDATAVPLTTGARVSVTATSVCVLVPATAGASIVMLPDVDPSRIRLVESTPGDTMPVVPLIVTGIMLLLQA